MKHPLILKKEEAKKIRNHLTRWNKSMKLKQHDMPKEEHIDLPAGFKNRPPYTPMERTAFEAKLIQEEKDERRMNRENYIHGIQGRDGDGL
jgi:hypothetical protein